MFWLVFIVFAVTTATTALTVDSAVAGMMVVKVTVEVPLLCEAATALELTM